jgi:hypothetical protein
MQSANILAYSGSSSGRLVRPMNKLTNPFRWMGCNIAVYDVASPREGGMKGRKVPHVRSANRRGSRSRRGGRKRRALVSAAPETSKPRVSTFGPSDRVLLRRMRTFEYSARLSAHVRGLREATVRVGRAVEVSSTPYDNCHAHHRAVKVALRHAARRWRDLRKGTHPGEPTFSREMAYQIETGEITPGLSYDLRPAMGDVIAQVIPSPPSAMKGKQNDEEPVAQYWCTKCCRTTSAKVCRLCGAWVGPPRRKDRGGERKHAQGPPPPLTRAKANGNSAPKVPRFRCPKCTRLNPCSCPTSSRRK